MRKSIVSVSMLAVLLACRSDKPEDQVRKAFGSCVTAVEAGDAGAAVAPLDPAFRGPEGMDKAAARFFLADLLRREKVGITVLRNEVTVQGGEAFQEVDLLLAGGGGLLPRDASRRAFGLRWRKAGGDWRITEIQER
jgi:hypothetical protein